MSSLVAIIPVADMAAANAALEAAGYGPDNFCKPAWTSGVVPAYARLHTWGDAGLAAAVKSLGGVVWDEGSDDDPTSLMATLTAANGAVFLIPEMPLGPVTANAYYQLDGVLWQCIQAHDRSVFSAIPETYPALWRKVRKPGEVAPWVQPLSTNPYTNSNPFTGKPDRVTHSGRTWESQHPANVWEPGVVAETIWLDVGPA